VSTLKRRRESRAEILLPNGVVLVLRAAFGRGILNVCDKTVQRMNLPTTYVGGVAYVDRDASLEIIGAGVRPRLQPRATDRDAKVA
jgi:hypothetical protein